MSHAAAPAQSSEQTASRRELFLLGTSAALFLGTLVCQSAIQDAWGVWGMRLCYALPYLACGLSIFRQAFSLALRGDLINEFTLMCGATVAAIIIGALPEAVGVMLFYRIGEFFQDRAASSARGSIRALLAARPVNARVVQSSGSPDPETSADVILPVESVGVGQMTRVLPGEKIPLDGEIVHGSSDVDQSPLTGESMPVSVGPGDPVPGGAVNLSGALLIRTTSLFSDTHMARILAMVEHAAARKAPTERFITRFAKYYTPLVVALAVLVATLPPLLVPGQSFSIWVYRALVMLVISCPCALMISIPLGYFGGIGAASREGILVKGGAVLDSLLRVNAVVFDKTGTLTAGVFEVTGVLPAPGVEPGTLLSIAAAVEKYSTHPLARAVTRHAEQNAAPLLSLSGAVRELPGKGVELLRGETCYRVGTARFLEEHGISVPKPLQDGPQAHVAENGRYLGCLTAAGALKPEARRAVAELKGAGLRVWMLTGDRRAAAERAAGELCLDGFEAELLPEGKVEALMRVTDVSRGAFVGDGINDAPILALSRVGIAMGGIGAEAAIEAADAVILNDSPMKVGRLFQIARRVRSIVRQNIVMALGIKTLFMVLGITGLSGLWEAVFADVGVALLAVLNATRVMRP